MIQSFLHVHRIVFIRKQVAKRQQQELSDEKIAKAERERIRLSRLWSNERQMAKASSTYEANVMTEIVANGDSLFG